MLWLKHLIGFYASAKGFPILSDNICFHYNGNEREPYSPTPAQSGSVVVCSFAFVCQGNSSAFQLHYMRSTLSTENIHYLLHSFKMLWFLSSLVISRKRGASLILRRLLGKVSFEMF